MKHKKRLQNILMSLLAMASMFASSVSACTCSHHQEQAEAETSCHAQSHYQDASVEQTSASSKSLESSCECVLVKLAPAVIARSDKKDSLPQPDAKPPELQNSSFDTGTIVTLVSTTIERSELYFPSNRLTGLIPARAPPRL